jgi:hypothetical protein
MTQCYIWTMGSVLVVIGLIVLAVGGAILWRLWEVEGEKKAKRSQKSSEASGRPGGPDDQKPIGRRQT